MKIQLVPRNRTANFFFFDCKLLQRQNVSASKRFGTTRYGRRNIDTKKLQIRARKCSHPHNSVTLARRIAIEHRFYWEVSGGTNCFPT